MSAYPLVFRIAQKFNGPHVLDVPGTVEAELSRLSLAEKIQPGETVAITVGSRGISNIRVIIQSVVGHLKRIGADPFIVPAMGSHGGGTAAGQRQILESHGVTEDFCGCPIRASMETVVVCQAVEGFPVHFDQHAYNADHVFVCNRIKPHTLFTGDFESGLMKMMLIGLGKHNGASIYHQVIRDYTFNQIVRSVVREVMAKCSIVAGLAVVENSICQTAKIEAIAPQDLEDREKLLLIEAKQWIPQLPFSTADILLIDEIGKNVSGSGMDVNVVGRKHLLHRSAENEFPKVKMIAVRNLTSKSYGNAIGIGLAEFCRTRVLEKMDVEITRVNVLTGGHVAEAMSPLDYQTDQEMLQVMLSQIRSAQPSEVKLLWIRNTSALSEVECSEAFLDDARNRNDLKILTDLRPLPLDTSGNLCDEQLLANVTK